jgi:hypothetical protein
LGYPWRGENTHHATFNFYPIFIPLFEAKVSGVSKYRPLNTDLVATEDQQR